MKPQILDIENVLIIQLDQMLIDDMSMDTHYKYVIRTKFRGILYHLKGHLFCDIIAQLGECND